MAPSTTHIPLSDRDIARFWTKVEQASACWAFDGHPTPFGHCKIGIQILDPRRPGKRTTKPFYAHRVSWQIHFGDIPDGAVVMHTCDNPGCVRPEHLRLGTTAENIAEARAKGRWHNDPARKKRIPSKSRPTRAERLREKIAMRGADECWPFHGALDTNGYGLLWDNDKGRKVVAHRVAYELAKGQIPPGLVVMHSCDNPPCCNPAHLSVGTKGDNNRDRTAKGRTNRPQGEANPKRKVTDAQVAEIRRLYAAGGVSQAALGAIFGIHQTQVSRIVRGEHRAGSPSDGRRSLGQNAQHRHPGRVLD